MNTCIQQYTFIFRKVLSTAVLTYEVRPVGNVDIDTTAIRPRYYTPSERTYDVRPDSFVAASIGTYVIRPNSSELVKFSTVFSS